MICLHTSTLAAHFREIYRGVGLHPTATRAMTLLRINTHFNNNSASIANEYYLSVFAAAEVISFCIDSTRVLVADVTEDCSGLLNSKAPSCLVVDDHRERTACVGTTAWS
eukprot:PhM_4_TR15250/c0_g1_i1/m.25249